MGSGWFIYGVSPRPDRDLPGCPSTLFFASTLTPSDDLKANMDRGIRTPASSSRGSAQPSPIEIDLVVAQQLEVLKPMAPGHDIEGNIQDMIGLVVGKMAFQKMETSVDVGDQSGPAGDQEHGPDTPGGESLNPIGQFVLDVVGGDHGTFPLGTGTILDTAENSSLALPQFVEDIGIHSKASVAWNSEDV